MADIPPWVYIGSGLLVSIVSAISYDKFVFFFWIGCLFVIVGAVKYLIGRVRKPVEIEHKKRMAYEQVNKMQQHYKKCYYCGNTLRREDAYCTRCGSRQTN